jgi:hypothetical protein
MVAATRTTDRFLIIFVDLSTETLVIIGLVLQAESVILQPVSGGDPLGVCLVLLSKFLSFGNHSVDFILRKTALVVIDRDRLRLSCAFVASRNSQDSVGVKLKRNLDLGNTTGSWWNASKIELAEEIVILGH